MVLFVLHILRVLGGHCTHAALDEKSKAVHTQISADRLEQCTRTILHRGHSAMHARIHFRFGQPRTQALVQCVQLLRGKFLCSCTFLLVAPMFVYQRGSCEGSVIECEYCRSI